MIYIISLYRGGIEKFVRPTEYTGQAGQDSDRVSIWVKQQRLN